MIKLLGRKTSGNVQKVVFALEEIGEAYEREDYGRQFNNTETPEYIALNPASKVPTLIDGDIIIWESNTILRYLAAIYAPNLGGETAGERALIEPWMDFLLAAINPGYLAAFKGSKLAPSERLPDFDAQISELNKNMSLLDRQLEGRSYLALERLTLADIACGPILARCLDFPIERPVMANLERWRGSLSERKAFKVATS